MILVDTSVWIDHLHSGDAHLSALLDHGMVQTHDFIIGEIACGNLKTGNKLYICSPAYPDAPPPLQKKRYFSLSVMA